MPVKTFFAQITRVASEDPEEMFKLFEYLDTLVNEFERETLYKCFVPGIDSPKRVEIKFVKDKIISSKSNDSLYRTISYVIEDIK